MHPGAVWAGVGTTKIHQLYPKTFLNTAVFVAVLYIMSYAHKQRLCRQSALCLICTWFVCSILAPYRFTSHKRFADNIGLACDWNHNPALYLCPSFLLHLCANCCIEPETATGNWKMTAQTCGSEAQLWDYKARLGFESINVCCGPKKRNCRDSSFSPSRS